jgi:hypothetical protein
MITKVYWAPPNDKTVSNRFQSIAARSLEYIPTSIGIIIFRLRFRARNDHVPQCIYSCCNKNSIICCYSCGNNNQHHQRLAIVLKNHRTNRLIPRQATGEVTLQSESCCNFDNDIKNHNHLTLPTMDPFSVRSLIPCFGRKHA